MTQAICCTTCQNALRACLTCTSHACFFCRARQCPRCHAATLTHGLYLSILSGAVDPTTVAHWRGITDHCVTLRTPERFLPRLLVLANRIASTSEVRRTKPEWWRTLEPGERLALRTSKRDIYGLWIAVGDE